MWRVNLFNNGRFAIISLASFDDIGTSHGMFAQYQVCVFFKIGGLISILIANVDMFVHRVSWGLTACCMNVKCDSGRQWKILSSIKCWMLAVSLLDSISWDDCIFAWWYKTFTSIAAKGSCQTGLASVDFPCLVTARDNLLVVCFPPQILSPHQKPLRLTPSLITQVLSFTTRREQKIQNYRKINRDLVMSSNFGKYTTQAYSTYNESPSGCTSGLHPSTAVCWPSSQLIRCRVPHP